MGADNNIYSFPGGSAESGNRPIDDHTQKTINGKNELQNSICRHPSNIIKSIENNERVNQLQLINELSEISLNIAKIDLFNDDDNSDPELSETKNQNVKQVLEDFFTNLYSLNFPNEDIKNMVNNMIYQLGDPKKNKKVWLDYTSLAKEYYENRTEKLAMKIYTPYSKK